MNSTTRIQTRTQTAAARKTKNSQGARSEPRVRSARTPKRAVNQTPRARAATTSRAERTAPPVREPKRPDGTIVWTIEDAERKLASDPGYGKRLQSPNVTVKGLRFNMVAFPVGRPSAGGRPQNVLAIYLRVATSDPGRRRRVDVDFKFQIDKHNGPHRRRRSPKCDFDLVHHDGHTPVGEYEDGHGFEGLLSYKVLFDPTKGYLVDEAITLRAEFTVLDSTADDIDEPNVGGEENLPNAGAEENEPNVTAEVNQRNEDDDEIIEVKTVKLMKLIYPKAEAVAQEPVEASEQEPEAPAEDEPQSDDDDCVIIEREEAKPIAAVGVTNAAAARIAKQEPSGEKEPGPDESSERAQMLEHAPSNGDGHQLATVPTPPTPCVNTEASEARPWSSCSSIRSLLDDSADGRDYIARLEFDGVPTDVLPIGDAALNDIFAPLEDVPEVDVDQQLANSHPEPNSEAVAEPNTAAISVHVAAATAQQGQLAENTPGPSVPGAGKGMFLDFIWESYPDATGKAYVFALMAGKSATDLLKEKNLHQEFVDFVLGKLREENLHTKAFMKMLRATGRIEEYAVFAVETSPAMNDYIRAMRLDDFMRAIVS